MCLKFTKTIYLKGETRNERFARCRGIIVEEFEEIIKQKEVEDAEKKRTNRA